MENDQSESTIARSQDSGRNFSITGHPLPQGHPAIEPTSRDEDRCGQVIDSGQLGQQPRARSASSSRKLDEAPSFNIRSRNDNETNGYCPTQRDETKSEQAGQQGQDKNEFKVSWDGDHDSMNPKCMSKAQKWLIVAILSTSSTCVTCASSLYTSTYTYAQLEQEFHCSKIVAKLGLSIFVAGLGIGSMLLGPLSEFYGRRYIYIVSFVLFVIWLVPCAVTRIFKRSGSLAFSTESLEVHSSVAGGTVGDMFSRDELQAPMMIFTASPFNRLIDWQLHQSVRKLALVFLCTAYLGRGDASADHSYHPGDLSSSPTPAKGYQGAGRDG